MQALVRSLFLRNVVSSHVTCENCCQDGVQACHACESDKSVQFAGDAPTHIAHNSVGRSTDVPVDSMERTQPRACMLCVALQVSQ